VVLAAWASDARAGSGAGAALRLGGAVWLSALHTRIHVGPAVVGLPPLGLTLVVAALVARAAGGLARGREERGEARDGRWRELGAVAGAVAGWHALLAAGVAWLAGTATLHPSPATALVGGLAVGFAGASAGVLRAQHTDGAPLARDRLSPAAGAVLAGGLAAVAAVAAVAALAAGVLLALHAAQVGDVQAALAPGAAGAGALTLLEACLVPDLVVWGVAWLAGPGFAVGAASSVTPWGTTVGRVPALPLLAGLPSGRSGAGVAVLLVPVAAGVFAGALVLRRSRSGSAAAGLGLAVLTGPVAGLLAAAAAAAAGGPAGPGRLETIGPSAWRVGLALTAEVTAGAALAVAGRQLWRHREPLAHSASAGARSGAGRARVAARAGGAGVAGGGAALRARVRSVLAQGRNAGGDTGPQAAPSDPEGQPEPEEEKVTARMITDPKNATHR